MRKAGTAHATVRDSIFAAGVSTVRRRRTLICSLNKLESVKQMEQNAKPNRLIHEKSPYLQQHAHNPVEWYPWCPEAFEKAREQDKPIFLSIGYSTCHWCHVMER